MRSNVLIKVEINQVSFFVSVASHIPYLFHLVTLLVSVGPATIRASIHGLLINVIQSLCTCSYITFTGKLSFDSTLLRLYRLFYCKSWLPR